ncbi:hypothetical protein [Phytohabitans suffuscus]|uniref:Uncharacterized protein n=1 Tax=Phytohabitans suffuscus TaxID=624315 RepID=A0A6F8YFE6_9ACTN|nr:hypothetical protein [Phytohabitans suffuscus]BCB84790.1 hypothetical protein Psuf_021030 [Phytohabitans suffuscus]
MLADLGYLGTAAITGTRKPRTGELGDIRRACNQTINRRWQSVQPQNAARASRAAGVSWPWPMA